MLRCLIVLLSVFGGSLGAQTAAPSLSPSAQALPQPLTRPALSPDGPWFNAFDLAAVSASAQAVDSAADTLQAFAALTTEARVQYRMSLVYDGHGLRPEAIQAAERSLDLAQAAVRAVSTSAEAQLQVAETAGRLGWIGGMRHALASSVRSASAIRLAKKLAPEDPAVLEAKARLQIYSPSLLGGKPLEAAAFFAELAEREPTDAWQAYWCAEAYLQAGKKDLARRYYQQALAADPRHRLAQSQWEKLK